MTNQQASTPQPENAKNRAKDQSRQAHGDDERLSRDAGYGRADSTPSKK